MVEYKERLLTVAEWIEILSEQPQDAIVVLSKDGEGNSFSPLAAYSKGFYEADSTWSGDFYTDGGETEESVKAVCLWPTN